MLKLGLIFMEHFMTQLAVFVCFVMLLSMTACNAVTVESTAAPGQTAKAGATATVIPKATIQVLGDAPFDVNQDIPTGSAFQLPSLINDHMVLQRDRQLLLWGECETDGDVAAIINGQAWFGKSSGGKFEVTVGPITAGGPYELTLRTATEKKVLRDVLFGDVYLCSGQSNMAMTLGETGNAELRTKYDNTNVRYLKVADKYSDTPLEDCTAGWIMGKKALISSVSAVAVVYGNTLQKQYNIPIGMIVSCVGGTRASCWMPAEEIEISKPIPYIDVVNYPISSEPSKYYNGMISPLKKLQIKGVVWYHGEGQDQKYETLLTNLIAGWRREFAQPDMYFIIIQLPRYDQGSIVWAKVREQQAKVGRTIKNTTYSVNIDCGEETNIHPLDKEPVGIRAAKAAMSLIYGEKGVLFGPTYKSFSVSGDSIIIELENIGSGLKLINSGTGFEICGSNNKYREATVQIDGNKLILRAEGISNPEQARYCYTDFPEFSLFNEEGLPCEPFRTNAY